MIRFIYWLLVVIEVLLIIAVLVLFIVTDSRTISMVAKYGMASSKFSYNSINGNLLEGLTVEKLMYDDGKLFDKARIHWNPLTLLNHKITITQMDMEGVDVENIIGMVKKMKSSSRTNNPLLLDYSLSLDKVHIDINPYLYEGVHFSSFLFNVDDIFVDKDLTIDADNLKLSFNSDIANVKLQGNVEKSRLLLDEVSLKEVSSVAITQLVKKIKSNRDKKKWVQRKENKTLFVPFKVIKVKHILGTLKPVKYGVLALKGATLNAYNFEADPYDNYKYNAKNITFEGRSNMALVKFKGFIHNSTTISKGEVLVEKELFSKYHLPLNYQGLKKIPASLTLNHKGILAEVNHKVKKLLTNQKLFNLDITKGNHKLSYLYGKNLIINSKLVGTNTYANEMSVEAKSVIDFKKKNIYYTGEASFSTFKAFVPHLSNYLLEGLTAKYEGKNRALLVDFESHLIHGNFKTVGYKDALLTVESKSDTIALNRVIEKLDSRFQQENFAFKSRTFLDFKNKENSTISLNIISNLITLNAQSNFTLPTKISSKVTIPQQSQLRKLDDKFNFNSVKDLDIDLVIDNNMYDIHLKDSNTMMKMALLYNAKSKQLEKGKLHLGSEEINFKSNGNDTFLLHTNIHNIQKLLKDIQFYYPLKVPNIEGAISVEVLQKRDKNTITMKSKRLRYLSDKNLEGKGFNIEDITVKFSIDKQSNIELHNYKFRIDTNPYLDQFYATKSSYFSFENGFFIINKFWINNEIAVTGKYDTNTLKGKLKLNSKSYTFNSDEINLIFDANLFIKLDKTKVDVEGDIDILGGRINYEIESSGLVEDSDIIVMQDIIKEKESAFNNLQLYLKIHNKKPLHYLGKNRQIEFYNELSVVKSFNQKMMITGMSTITKGYYEIEDKRFILDESHLYFAGDVRKPLLDIKANYHKEQYTVHIFISGTTDEPIINFNSDPYLKQQEILSLILFDGTGESDGTGAEAYTLLGGTFAKGLMRSLGINIDHFLLGTDSNNQLSLEIGKKISDNISLLYLNKDGLNGAKVKVEYNNNFETDIIIMPPNTSSIEFLYKRDH